MIKKIFKITSDILLYCFIFLGLITIIITLSSKKDIDGATNIFNYQLRLVITDSMAKCSETNVSKYKIKSIPKNSLVLIHIHLKYHLKQMLIHLLAISFYYKLP